MTETESQPIPSYVLNERLVANPEDANCDDIEAYRVFFHHLDPFGTLVFAHNPEAAIGGAAAFYVQRGFDGVFVSQDELQDFTEDELIALGDRFIARNEVHVDVLDGCGLIYLRALCAVRALCTTSSSLQQLEDIFGDELWPMDEPRSALGEAKRNVADLESRLMTQKDIEEQKIAEISKSMEEWRGISITALFDKVKAEQANGENRMYRRHYQIALEKIKTRLDADAVRKKPTQELIEEIWRVALTALVEPPTL